MDYICFCVPMHVSRVSVYSTLSGIDFERAVANFL